jgi:GT2 family glycosyltransferase
MSWDASTAMSDLLGHARLGVVVIGRNEGARLARCLASIRAIPNRVYVDSGSSDDSVALAEGEGVCVIELSEPPQFTAARARNAGIAHVLSADPETEFVQVVDGDCEVQAGWLAPALATLRSEPQLAAVFGRRRERHPELSIYNRLCDDEWDVPIGDAPAFGGDVLLRATALRQVNFYNPKMIAGEDPELAMRLRKDGWHLRRIDAEMTVHDAAMTRFGQWWSRTRRSGHAYGELANLHPDARDPNWQRSVHSILFWGCLLPTMLLAATISALTANSVVWLAATVLGLTWPMNMLRLARRERLRGLSPRVALASGVLLTVGKVPQFLGLLQYHRHRLLDRTSQLIEYKRREGT